MKYGGKSIENIQIWLKQVFVFVLLILMFHHGKRLDGHMHFVRLVFFTRSLLVQENRITVR